MTECQFSLSSENFMVKMFRACSVSGSFQEVRFSFLRLHRHSSPFALRLMTSSLSSSRRHLIYESVSVISEVLVNQWIITSQTLSHVAAPEGSGSNKWTLCFSTLDRKFPEQGSSMISSWMDWVHVPGLTGTSRRRLQPEDSCPPEERKRRDSDWI